MDAHIKKRIWIINHFATPPSLGGLNRHYYFKKFLEGKGYDVRIFSASQIHNSTRNMLQDKDGFLKTIEVDGIDYTFIKTKSYSGNSFKRIRNLFEFSKKIKKIPQYFNETPDVIYASSPDIFTARSSLRLSKKMKVPCVLEIRDLWPASIIHYGKSFFKSIAARFLFSLEKQIYQMSDRLIFTFEGGKDYIKDKKWDKSVNLDKIFNINNGVDNKLFNKQKEEYIFQDSDLENDKFFKAIYVGSIRKANNIKRIIEYAALAKEENLNIKFIIFGEGDDKDALLGYCAKYNIDNIIFKGFVDKKFIPYILSKADINLINFKQTEILKYGCSFNKLFDYFASGKPILSNVKVNFDLIKKYNCGFVAEDESARAMLYGIKKIISLPKTEYDLLCQNALRAAEDYDYEVLANRLIEVIESLK